jgi:hypothetical protein
VTTSSASNLRFLLPAPLGAVDVVGAETGLSAALRAAGGDGRSPVAIATAATAGEAARRGYACIVIEGRTRNALANQGYRAETFLTLPSVAEPSLVLPLRHRTACGYALANWTFPKTPLRRLRNRAARALLRRGLLPPVLPALTVATRAPALPFLVAAATKHGVPEDVEYFMRNAARDELSRGTFFLFERTRREPSWLLKFGRARGYDGPFDGDEQGLRLVEAAPASVSRHAPRLLGRFEAGGHHASLETAATGRPLADRLRQADDPRDKLALVDAVADWIVELGRSTRREDRLEAERARLEALLGDGAEAAYARERSLPRLRATPTVLQHNDLGCWNIIGDRDSFTAVDWESVQPAGLPLWDLWYFLRDALAAVDGVDAPGREAHLEALFRGELASSRVLFRWTQRAVEALGVPPEEVGAIATLCWLYHAGSHGRRIAAIEQHAPGTPGVDAFPLPRGWFTDDRLGNDWSAWRQ